MSQRRDLAGMLRNLSSSTYRVTEPVAEAELEQVAGVMGVPSKTEKIHWCSDWVEELCRHGREGANQILIRGINRVGSWRPTYFRDLETPVRRGGYSGLETFSGTEWV